MLNHDPDRGIHDEYAKLIQDASSTIKASNGETHDFCLERAVAEDEQLEQLDQPRKRKRSEPRRETIGDGHELSVPPSDSVTSTEVLRNGTDVPKEVTLQLSSDDLSPDRSSTYTLPPQSMVLLGDCSDTATFRSAAREYASHGRFDMIVMDPPWPNRSVSRSSSYGTTGLPELVDMLLSMDLDIHLKSGGFIAVWITNRAAVRDAVLGTSGLFESWGVQVCEEWVWCKVTQQGKPISKVDGLWRKPYEVCLIGKRSLGTNNAPSTIKRRVIFAVPDLHSRKPCLKGLFERLLLGQQDADSMPAVLEIFARCAVAGWMSWGNEAIKYNNNDYWSTMPERRRDAVL